MAQTTLPATITVHVPMTFMSRGACRVMLADAPSSAPKVRTDNALLKALARSHRWRNQIESGEYASITELAKANHINESYACRMLRLTLLAPAIICDILDGRSGSFMLKTLVCPVSPVWSEQSVALTQRARCLEGA